MRRRVRASEHTVGIGVCQPVPVLPRQPAETALAAGEPFGRTRPTVGPVGPAGTARVAVTVACALTTVACSTVESEDAADAVSPASDSPAVASEPAEPWPQSGADSDTAVPAWDQLVDTWEPLRVPEAGMSLAFPVARSNIADQPVAAPPDGSTSPEPAVAWRAELADHYQLHVVVLPRSPTAEVLPGSRARRAGVLAVVAPEPLSDVTILDSSLAREPAERITGRYLAATGAELVTRAVVTERGDTAVALALTTNLDRVPDVEARQLVGRWLDTVQLEPTPLADGAGSTRVELPQFPASVELPEGPIRDAVSFQGRNNEVLASEVSTRRAGVTTQVTGYLGPGVRERAALDPTAALRSLAVESADKATAAQTADAALHRAVAAALFGDVESTEVAEVHRVDGTAELDDGTTVTVSGFIDGQSAVVVATAGQDEAPAGADTHEELIRSLEW